MKITDTKKVLTGISIALAVALSGCGGSATTNSDTQALYSSQTSAITSRATTLISPKEPTVLSKDSQSVDVGFKYDLDMNNTTFDGFYLHVVKLPYGTQTLPEKQNWIDELQSHLAAIGSKDETIVQINTNEADDHHLIAKGLDANTTYAFIPAAYNTTNVNNDTITRDMVCDSYIITTTDALNDSNKSLPCLDVTSFMTQKTLKSRWADYTFGAHPVWTFAKDDNNQSIYDGARLYRSEVNDDGTTTEPQELFADDGVFDTERDYYDYPLTEGKTYQYTLQAYKLSDDGTTKEYADKNVTANVTMDPYTSSDLNTPVVE